MIEIRPADFSSAEMLELLALHLGGMHASSPPGTVFALDLSGLQVPDVSVWTAWIGSKQAGIGALKSIDSSSGEIKSMRTHPDHLRQGVGAALLMHIIREARARNWNKLSLETGHGPAFEAAHALYRRYGFFEGGPFSDYEPNHFSRFFHLRLDGSQCDNNRSDVRHVA